MWIMFPFSMCYFVNKPFKRQPHKMVKNTQTIRPHIAEELF